VTWAEIGRKIIYGGREINASPGDLFLGISIASARFIVTIAST
jgi:hypothetical protein